MDREGNEEDGGEFVTFGFPGESIITFGKS